LIRGLAALVAGALVMGACGPSSPMDVVGETTGNLSDSHSGVMSLDVTVSSSGHVGEANAGFSLRGPFQFPDHGGLPEARIAYTQMAGAERDRVVLISTPGKAYVDLHGIDYELPPGAQAQLEMPGSADQGLPDLPVGNWIRNPKLSSGGEVGGDPTDLVTAHLDVINALNALVRAASRFGLRELAGIGFIEGQAAEQLRRGVDFAQLRLWTGKDDRLLRRLLIRVHFGLANASGLPQGLADLASATFSFDLTIENPNQPIHVLPPRHARPYTELPS
jgi:hypothetical protein